MDILEESGYEATHKVGKEPKKDKNEK